MKYFSAAAVVGWSAGLAAAQCSQTITADYPAPSLADGWGATLIANGLGKARGLIFDTAGHLLYVNATRDGQKIVGLTLAGDAPCLSVSETKTIVENFENLNHGIQFSADGRTLYASSPGAVYAWDYDAEQQETTSDARTVVRMEEGDGHSTRTLLMSRQVENMLLVSWGSQGNIDDAAKDLSTGISQIKAFDVSDPSKSYDFASEGTTMGWGLRNSVGIAENPVTGGIFSVENNVDNMERDGQDIHQNNPAEELNFHGYLNGTEYKNQGANYGYPSCFPAWDVSEVPNYDGLKTGQQFSIGDQDENTNDTYCRDSTVPPTLSFAAHMAPLDIKFNQEATVAYVTFRGSWNRENPQGYKLSAIAFDNSTGLPVASPDSQDGYVDIVSNQDLSKCPDNCFRPVAMAWDGEGRLFMTSDATGEIYVVSRSDNTPVDDAPPPSPTGGSNAPEPSESSPGGSAATSFGPSSWALGCIFLVIAYFL